MRRCQAGADERPLDLGRSASGESLGRCGSPRHPECFLVQYGLHLTPMTYREDKPTTCAPNSRPGHVLLTSAPAHVQKGLQTTPVVLCLCPANNENGYHYRLCEKAGCCYCRTHDEGQHGTAPRSQAYPTRRARVVSATAEDHHGGPHARCPSNHRPASRRGIPAAHYKQAHSDQVRPSPPASH
jgi:hypothetical protein